LQENRIFFHSIIDIYPSAHPVGTKQQQITNQENNKLLENLEQYKKRIEASEGDTLSPRSEKAHLNIIAALLEVIIGKSPGIEKKHPDFPNQARLIEHLCQFEMPGLSKINLELKFAAAMRSLESDS